MCPTKLCLNRPSRSHILMVLSEEQLMRKSSCLDKLSLRTGPEWALTALCLPLLDYDIFTLNFSRFGSIYHLRMRSPCLSLRWKAHRWPVLCVPQTWRVEFAVWSSRLTPNHPLLLRLIASCFRYLIHFSRKAHTRHCFFMSSKASDEGRILGCGDCPDQPLCLFHRLFDLNVIYSSNA